MFRVHLAFLGHFSVRLGYWDSLMSKVYPKGIFVISSPRCFYAKDECLGFIHPSKVILVSIKGIEIFSC